MKCSRGLPHRQRARRAGGSLPNLRLHPRTVIANCGSKQEELKSTKMAEATSRFPYAPFLK